MKPSSKSNAAPRAAFLLAQLGAHAARRFGERLEAVGLGPPHAGILRMIAADAKNQKELADHLGLFPSRMVALIDELTTRGLVARERSLEDRRHSLLSLTKQGKEVLKEISQIAAAHEADLLAALTPDERASLAGLCRKVADQQGLTPGVHPGYREL